MTSPHATPHTASTATRISLPAHDGHNLGVYCYEPVAKPHGGVVIGPAIAVPQSFYADFAHYLASQGYRVWTFDYRGMGESWQGSMRTCKADISDWVLRDYDAVVHHASAQMQDLPLFILGHSLGGQTIPLLPALATIGNFSGAINVAVGSGAMRHNRPDLRRKAPLLWYLFAPVFCPLFGYFPGSKIGVIGDIPTQALFQWRRWCLTPDYLLSGEPGAREAYARANWPVLGLTLSDDELLLESGSQMLHQALGQAQVDYRLLKPEQFGLKRIGHFGFFKKAQEKALWPIVTAWLQQRHTRPALAPA
jgi:predicted alpha/beta hydrolase